MELNEFNILNESFEGNVIEEFRLVIEVVFGVEYMGLGVVDDLAYIEGLYVVVNLLSRIFTEVENFLLFKGLLFCFILEEIDMFIFRKDIMEYVR